MPTYYFDVREEGVVLADDVGQEMADLAAAEREATEAAAAIATGQVRRGTRAGRSSIDVRDEDGAHVLSVTASLSIVRAG